MLLIRGGVLYFLTTWLAVTTSACSPRLVVLEPDRVLPAHVRSAEPRLEVISTLAGGRDPLPVGCASYAFAGVANSIGEFVAAAAQGWADNHLTQRPGGWQMLVELVRDRAESSGETVSVELEIRVTLRSRTGQINIGQKQGYCKTSGQVSGGDSSKVIYQCMDRMAHDVADWLEGIHP